MDFVKIRNFGSAEAFYATLPPLRGLPRPVYRKFVDNGAWYTPTLTVSRAVMLLGDSAARAILSGDAIRLDERTTYASAWLLEWWRMQVDERATDTSSTRAAAAEEAYANSASDVRRMREVGVTILAGSVAGRCWAFAGHGPYAHVRPVR